MYSRKVTDRKIAQASRKIGFQITAHSLEEIETQIKRLNEIVGDDGRLTRPLRGDEKQFIINERLLSKLDFRYFCEKYAMVMFYEGGKIVHFKPNVAQEIVLQVWGEMEDSEVAIMLQQLKARQLGVSTLTEIAVIHRTQFYKHTNALIASYDPDQSKKMAGMMDRAYDNEPWWLKPEVTSYREDVLREFGNLDSGISIQHGSQFTGLGRGSTPNVAHLSEVAEYIEPEELIDASLLNAMHPSPKMFLVLESTAKGRKNYWHRLWEHSKTNYDSGRASLYPMFLPWFMGRDIYPTETWLKMHPIPQEYEPAALTCHHAERARNYVQSNELLKKFLGESWEMPVEQMWWWEVTREEYKNKDILNKFYEEMPADDLEAFQSTNRSAFDADILSVYREGCKPPLGVFGLRGRPDEIPPRLWPDRREVDAESPIINVKSRWIPSQPSIDCQLVPLKVREWPLRDPMGKFIVWEMPEDEEEYGVGIDTGDGVGLDRTTTEILRKATHERPWAQVAEFHSPYVGALEFWPMALAFSTLYSVHRQGQVRQCRVAIDCLRNGEAVQHEMRKRGWWNFHPWLRYDKKKLRTKDSHRMGTFSNVWFRAMMMDYIITGLKDESIDIFSPYFVDEMGDLERDDVRQSLKACFLAGTEVTAWDSSRIRIEDVPVGAEVISHSGRRSIVSDVCVRQFKGQAIQIKCAGLPAPVSCTPTHEFWCRTRTHKTLFWRKRREFPSSWKRADEIKKGDWIGVPKRKGLKDNNLKPEWLYLVGFWLAEGNIIFDKGRRPCALEFTNTKPEFLTRCLGILQDWFPQTTIHNNQFGGARTIRCRHFLNSRKRNENWRRTWTLIYYCREAAELFFTAFGSGHAEKKICQDIYERKGLLPVVSGFIDGDGTQRNGQQHDVSFYTCSKSLSWQLRQILLDNGIWCTIRNHDPGGQRKVSWIVNIKSPYLEKLYPCKVVPIVHPPSRHVIEDEGHFYTAVRSITRVAHDGPVYDLTVEGEHTYTANGLSCHNTYGGHDDLFVGMGMIYFSMVIMDMRSGKPPMMPARRRNHEIVYEDPVWTPGYQASDSGPRESGVMDDLLLEQEEMEEG